MKKNRGFTILETLIVIVVLGILTAKTLFIIKSNVAQTTLEKAANSLYTDLQCLHSVCLKNDEMVMVDFRNSSEQYNIYVDENNDSTIQESELYKTRKLPSSVSFGICEEAPSPWMFNYEPQDGLADNWKSVLFVAPDSRRQYSFGGVYLTIPNLPEITFFIGIKAGMQSIKLFKWKGSSWIEL
jgi:prepilin-type N-terminal cleavage/methylation domain-containing protein